MNVSNGHEKQADDAALEREIDLLVDGALGLQRRRALVAQLDSVPGGWRLCALTYLEAQSLRDDLRAIAAPQREAGLPAMPSAIVRSRFKQSVPIALAMAASFLLAFGLGLAVRSQLGQLPASGRPNPLAKERDRRSTLPERNLAKQTEPGDELALAHTAGGAVDTIWLPAAEDGSQLVLPEELARQLQVRGDQFDRRQEFWPVELQDGRRGLLPVERLDVRYVDQEYQ